MRYLIITTFKLFLLFFLSLAALSCFAGQGSIKPVSPTIFSIVNISKIDSMLNARVSIVTMQKASETSFKESSTSAGRICACQVLNLKSSNYNHRYVVLLAEKTNVGSSSAYHIAKDRIQKEKRQLKKMFYDKVQVVAELQGTGSCKSMFYQLRTADKNLQLYEILNADIN